MPLETLFKMFPPPTLLAVPYAGLDISDDAIHIISYGSNFGRTYIKSFFSVDLPEGLMDGGGTKDEAKLTQEIRSCADHIGFTHVKVAIPEEKAYLFETEVPMADIKSIRQNIESKLEENVPLTAKDALFYFDLLPPATEKGPLRASVSVVPRTYIEHILKIVKNAGLTVVAFEVVPRALARMAVNSLETSVLIHLMKHKIGAYIVSERSVYFTSTLSNRILTGSRLSPSDALKQEIERINEYWMSHAANLPIKRIFLIGKDALTFEKELGGSVLNPPVPVSVPNVWEVVCGSTYVCPISKDQSLEYAVAAGLALPS